MHLDTSCCGCSTTVTGERAAHHGRFRSVLWLLFLRYIPILDSAFFPPGSIRSPGCGYDALAFLIDCILCLRHETADSGWLTDTRCQQKLARDVGKLALLESDSEVPNRFFVYSRLRSHTSGKGRLSRRRLSAHSDGAGRRAAATNFPVTFAMKEFQCWAFVG